ARRSRRRPGSTRVSVPGRPSSPPLVPPKPPPGLALLMVQSRSADYSFFGEPMPEIYVSTDVETDGPIPGPHSLLSFASAAYRADKTLLGTFAANLHTLPAARGHP